ncbi:MAG: leucine-rich repeat protein [Clostridiales bacterium]|nr:leucine-rich repeat protein [Clostridiales bacterium]
MSDNLGFQIVDGVLKKYSGKDPEVTIPEEVAKIASRAFMFNSKLVKVNIPGSVKEIGDDAFNSCTKLSEVNLEDGVETIGIGAFCRCPSLREITIPGSCTILTPVVFCQCKKLSKVNILPGVTDILSKAFEDCQNLTEVFIPDTVTYIEEDAFGGTPWLENKKKENPGFTLRSIYDQEAATSSEVEEESSSDTENEIQWIQDFAIQNGFLVKYTGHDPEVTIPKEIMYIYQEAFASNTDLERVVIPSHVQEIGSHAFLCCTNLKEVILENGVGPVRGGVFQGCSSLREITIPGSCRYLNYDLFKDCTGLEKVTLLPGITDIGPSVFQGCVNLTEISLPDTVESIADGTFDDTPWLENKKAECPWFTLRSLYDKDYVCGDVVISEGITEIKERAYYNNMGIRSVVIPEGVTTIGKAAFSGCKNMISVSLPSTLKTIESGAFYICENLEDVTIPPSVTLIGHWAFDGTKWQKKKYTKDKLLIVNGILAQGNKYVGELTVPAKVKSFSPSAFSSAFELTGITIPGHIKEISPDCFNGARYVKKVTFSEGLEIVGRYSFFDNRMDEVYLPDTVTEVRDKAFCKCINLKKIRIPNGAKIGEKILEECFRLETVVAPSPLACYGLTGTCVALVIPGETRQYYCYVAKTHSNNLSIGKNGQVTPTGDWSEYDLELINGGPKFKYKMPGRLIGALGRLMNPSKMTGQNRRLLEELVNSEAEKYAGIAEDLNMPEILSDLFALGILEEKAIKALKKKMAKSEVSEIAALADVEVQAAAPKKEEEETFNPLKKEYREKYKAVGGEKILADMKLTGVALPVVKMQDGTEAPEELFKYILVSYGSQLEKGYQILPEVDEVTSLLSRISLCEVMDEMIKNMNGVDYPSILPFLCRYGNAEHVRALIKSWNKWGNYMRYHKRGKAAQKIFNEALVLNDTKEAMLWLQKWTGLKNYAAIRGLKVDEAYEKCLFDFGFNAEGKRILDLGSTRVEVRLGPDMQSCFYDTKKGKTVKTLPKSGVDPDVYKVVSEELADMKHNLSKSVEVKRELLLLQFLDGKTSTVASWKKHYLENPILRKIAGLVVWTQKEKTFMVSEDGFIDSLGNEYTLGRSSIGIAHPMEMKEDEVLLWQKYFLERGLEPAFCQMEEPVYDPEKLSENRYEKKSIWASDLTDQQKIGIRCYWTEPHYANSVKLEIKDFEVELVPEGEMEYFPDRSFVWVAIRRIRPLTWNRRTNHVIAYLDQESHDYN